MWSGGPPPFTCRLWVVNADTRVRVILCLYKCGVVGVCVHVCMCANMCVHACVPVRNR